MHNMTNDNHHPQMTQPQTKAQGFAYGLFMTVFMTTGMELYNNAVKLGINLQPGGFSNMTYALVPEALREIVFMAPVVWVISNLYGNRLGARLASRLIDSERDSSFWRSCVVIACTTLVMCPSMSLFASVLFNVVLAGRSLVELPIIWLGTVFKNFQVALLWNLFAASPLSRISLRAVLALRKKTSRTWEQLSARGGAARSGA